ncbi:zinc-ribbon domain-containing protein [Pseudolysinimonas sp.]|uniref:zinc-ribbon domain-containing protein n=1 Tax=Pseudolysinimonas sp. TaxID=2680009 RepID=UPI003F7D3D78
MNCRYCGADLPEGALFCGECGRAVSLPDPEPVRLPAPVREVRPDPVPAPAPAPAERSIGEPPAAAPGIAPVVAPPFAALTEAPPPVGSPRRDVAPPPTIAAPPAPVVAPEPVAFSAADAASDDPADHVGAVRPTPTCPQCGTPYEDDEIFCGECGFVLRTVPPTPFDPVPFDPAPVDAESFDGGIDAAAVAEPAAAEAAPSAPPAPEPVAPPAPPLDLSATDLVPALEPDLELSLDRTPRPDPPAWGMQRPVVEDLGIEDLERTRLTVDPQASQRFVLQFSTGENVTVTGAGLVGRNPVAEPGEYVDQLVAIFDPSKSVSKTHLEFGQEAGRFWVSDRFSTNGSVVRQPDEEPRRCDPGKRYFVARGTRVDVGEQFFVVS